MRMPFTGRLEEIGRELGRLRTEMQYKHSILEMRSSSAWEHYEAQCNKALQAIKDEALNPSAQNIGSSAFQHWHGVLVGRCMELQKIVGEKASLEASIQKAAKRIEDLETEANRMVSTNPV